MANRYWTCSRVTDGVRCGRQNLAKKRKCEWCGKPRPARRRPAHMRALNLSYEQYVELNGGDRCGICGATQKPGGRRLHRDHDHRLAVPRGLLCFRCNTALRPYMTVEWLTAALKYVQRDPGPESEAAA